MSYVIDLLAINSWKIKRWNAGQLYVVKTAATPLNAPSRMTRFHCFALNTLGRIYHSVSQVVVVDVLL